MDKSWMILTDAEFAEFLPVDASLKVAFYDSTDTRTLMTTTARQIRSNRITKLYLLAHGISVTSRGSSLGMSMEGDYSLPEKVHGFGLMMGSTPIAIDNDHLFSAWGGCGLKTILLVSCAIVNGDGSGRWGDGRTMCQHIANYTGATVYASDTVQTIGLDWAGNLFEFKPYYNTGGRLLSQPYPQVTERVDG